MQIIDDTIIKAISLLNTNGYKAYLVGGFVRDMIMNKTSSDVDITTDATPEQIIKVFENYKTILTGIKHATVTVIFEQLPLEITTFRLESAYSDGRHPDKVTFTCKLSEDLKRRDFTMNAIAYHSQTGFIDPFNGADDIKNGVIRCVGTARQRFEEDSLRILRALRFSATLGFEIEENTSKAMFDTCKLLKNVSNERIFAEFCKLICGKNAKKVITDYFNIIKTFLLNCEQMQNFNQLNPHHIYDVLEHTSVVLDNISPILHLRLAAFFHDCAKPKCFSLDENGVGHFYSHASYSAKIAHDILTDLRCDNATKDKVVKLIKIHDTPIQANEIFIKKRLSRLGEEMFFDLISVQRADNLGLAPEYHYRQKTYDEIIQIAKNLIAQNECFSLKHLAINGNDLIAIGINGKQIGQMLKLILEKVIDGELKNEQDTLINFAKSI